MLGLVARFADMWNGWLWATSADAVRPAREAVDSARTEAGRDARSLRRSMVCVIALDGPMAERQGVITGSEEHIAATLVSFRAEGIHEVQIRLFPNDHAAIQRFSSIIRHVKAAATA